MSSFKSIPATSLQYLDPPVVVTPKDLDNVPFDPTTDSVAFAFVANGDDIDLATFYPGVWGTDASTTPDTYQATILVGPGGTVTLIEGNYNVLIKITDSPEVPVIPIPGLLTVL